MTTLYQQLGNKLPKYGSTERTTLANEAGVGAGYTGNAQQNSAIVNYLKNKQAGNATGTTGTTGTTTPPVNTPPVKTDLSQFNYTENPDYTTQENLINSNAKADTTSYESSYNSIRQAIKDRTDSARRAADAEKSRIAAQFEQRRNQQNAANIRSGIVGSGADNALIAGQDAEQNKANALVEDKYNAEVNAANQTGTEYAVKANEFATSTRDKTQKELNAITEKRVTDKKEKLAGLSALLMEKGIDPSKLTTEELNQLGKQYGASGNQIQSNYIGYKQAFDKNQLAETKTTLDNQKTTAEIGKLNAEAGKLSGKTYTISNGKVSVNSGGGNTTGNVGKNGVNLNLSSAAQDIVDAVNNGAGEIDDYIKGTSKEAQRLRNEVLSGLKSGFSQSKINDMQVTRDLAKDLENVNLGDAVGFSVSKLGGDFAKEKGLAPDRAKQEAMINNLKARLTGENLGKLKGAMSDKDIVFLQQMSNQLDTGMSQTDFKEKVKDITTFMDKKLANTTNQNNYTVPPKKETSQGLSPDEVAYLKSKGITDTSNLK